MDNSFLVDMQERCICNTISGFVTANSVRWIPSVAVCNLYYKPLEPGEIVYMIVASERYSRYATCCSSEQTAILPEHKPCHYEILLKDMQEKLHTWAVKKTTGEGDEALQKYLVETLPTGKVRLLCTATGSLILFIRMNN